MDRIKEETIANIRAVLTSTKGSMSVKELNRDFEMLIGTRIPHRDLGFSSVEQFLSSIPTLMTSNSPDGMMVDARATAQTAHIADMVRAQKDTRKKPKSSSRRPQYRPNTNNINPSYYTWQPAKRKNNVPNRRPPPNTTSNRLSKVVKHTQFVELPNTPKRSSPPQQQNVNRKLQHSTSQQQPQQQNKQQSPPQLASRPASTRPPLLPTPPQSQQIINQGSGSGSSTRIHKISQLMSQHQAQKSSPPPQNGQSLNGKSSNMISPDSLQNESMKNLDLNSSVWNWSSDESSPLQLKSGEERMKSTVHVVSRSNSISNTALRELTNFLLTNKLEEPDVKILTRRPNPRLPALYDCKIKVGKASYSSYPKDCKTEEEAKSEAARNALEDLGHKVGRRKSFLLSTEKDILARIPNMVEKHYAGLFNNQLEQDYTEKYNEQLPQNWLEIVDMLECISVEPCLENKFILRFCKPGEIFQKGKSFTPLASNVSVPSNTIQASEEFFLVEIMCPVAADEIWCRQLDTPQADSFDKMISLFEEYYERCGQIASTINVGGFYVAKIPDQGWRRVRVFDMIGNKVICFQIDSGDEDEVDKQNIYFLQRQFATEQQQAFVVQLQGLEELIEYSKTSPEMSTLQNKQVLIKAVPKTVDDDTSSNSSDSAADTILTVVMYDPTEKQYINEVLLTNLSVEAAVPMLNKNGIITDVFVVHSEDSGDLYIQVRPPGFSHLENLLENLSIEIEKNPSRFKPSKTFNKENLYFVRFSLYFNHWYRGKIVDWSPCKRFAQVYFLDFGNTEIKNIQTEIMYNLKELSPVLCAFAEQAIHVKMALTPIPSSFTKNVKTYMPDDQPVLMKILETRRDPETNADVPWVEFFKRSEPDNCLFSINKSLCLESEISPLIGDGNNNAKPEVSLKLKKLRSFRDTEELSPVSPIPSSGQLQAPPFPEVGKYFDVKIPCAVNPWNFFVQPLGSYSKLMRLMETLQERYGSNRHSPLHIEDIQPGKIYASKHDDGQWYRTCVMKVIHSGSISVFYCDFGYYANLTLQQLFPLDPDLMELPYQAIKAKLGGIKPKNLKWTMEDCEYFEKLVRLQAFVSILVEIGTDEMYRCDPVLNLKLIDTSTPQDVHIDKLLVENGIAVHVT